MFRSLKEKDQLESAQKSFRKKILEDSDDEIDREHYAIDVKTGSMSIDKGAPLVFQFDEPALNKPYKGLRFWKATGEEAKKSPQEMRLKENPYMRLANEALEKSDLKNTTSEACHPAAKSAGPRLLG